MNIEYYFILINSWRECNTIRKEVKVIKKQGQPVSIWTALLRRKTKGLLSASHENRMSGSIDRSSFREQVTSCNTPQHFHTDASNNLPTRVPPEERQKRKKKEEETENQVCLTVQPNARNISTFFSRQISPYESYTYRSSVPRLWNTCKRD